MNWPKFISVPWVQMLVKVKQSPLTAMLEGGGGIPKKVDSLKGLGCSKKL